MNSRLLYSCVLCAITNFGLAQSQDLIDWQSAHPTVSFIEKSDFIQFTEDEISKLNNNYIVFDEEIQLKDLESFEILSTEQDPQIQLANWTIKKSESQFIKDWLATHADVKIIKNSEYSSLSENQKNEYASAQALILSGEFLTRADILTYPY
jgi:hypothetical protein